MSHWSPRYLRRWDALLRPFGRFAVGNRYRWFGVQIMRLAKNTDSPPPMGEMGRD